MVYVLDMPLGTFIFLTIMFFVSLKIADKIGDEDEKRESKGAKGNGEPDV